MENHPHKLWGGRFETSPCKVLERLNSSINLDQRLFAEDIEGSKAYATALQKIGLLSAQETAEIHIGLERVKSEWESGVFQVLQEDEDIHTANERRLKEVIGEAATKLHVGRSRNDQVVTDMKLWMKKNLPSLGLLLKDVVQVVLWRAEKEIEVLMPGYTHLQRAQPVRWSHFLLSHCWNFKHDWEKLRTVLETVDVMPLGSGALAGNPFPVNRQELAEDLGFRSITPNSMQAVADRDFIVEFLFWGSTVGLHLSRLAEDLILFSSKEFDFIQIPDQLSTGSSLMPQKRNPDSLELIRGISGGLFGHACGFMMVLKGLPSTYNKDLQGDKEAMFATFDKLKVLLELLAGVLKGLIVKPENCLGALSFEMLATDLAYYLVRRRVPFRDAHYLAGKVVAEAENQGVSISELSLQDLRKISPIFDGDVQNIWDFAKSVEQYGTAGGTAKGVVFEQIEDLQTWIVTKNT